MRFTTPEGEAMASGDILVGCDGAHSVVRHAIGKLLRYRCHTGHAFTSSVLLAQQTVKIEETLWVALRMFEERQNLLVTMSKNESKKLSSSISLRAKDSQVHIERIRAMLKATDKDSHGEGGGKTPKSGFKAL